MPLYVIEMRNSNGGWDRIDPAPYINETGANERAKELAAELAAKDGCAACAVYRSIRVRDLDAAHPEFMLRMDWPLLRQQKLALMSIQSDYSAPESISQGQHEANMNAVEGLLNGLDAIQDYAVDVMGLDNEQVFGVGTPEEDEDEPV